MERPSPPDPAVLPHRPRSWSRGAIAAATPSASSAWFARSHAASNRDHSAASATAGPVAPSPRLPVSRRRTSCSAHPAARPFGTRVPAAVAAICILPPFIISGSSLCRAPWYLVTITRTVSGAVRRLKGRTARHGRADRHRTSVPDIPPAVPAAQRVAGPPTRRVCGAAGGHGAGLHPRLRGGHGAGGRAGAGRGVAARGARRRGAGAGVLRRAQAATGRAQDDHRTSWNDAR